MQKVTSLLSANKERILQLVRFGVVGVTATAIHYGVYLLILKWIGNPSIAYSVGYGVSFIINYYLTTYFTFRSKPGVKNAAGFGLSHLINYVMEIGLLNLFIYFGMSEVIAPIAVLALVVPINFLMLHYFFLSKKKRFF